MGNISVLLLFFPFVSVHNNLFFPIQDVDLKIYPGVRPHSLNRDPSQPIRPKKIVISFFLNWLVETNLCNGYHKILRF